MPSSARHGDSEAQVCTRQHSLLRSCHRNKSFALCLFATSEFLQLSGCFWPMPGECNFSYPDQHSGRLPSPRQSQACCPVPHPHSLVFCRPGTAGGAITICVPGIFTEAHLSHCSTHRRKQINMSNPVKRLTQPRISLCTQTGSIHSIR